MSDNLEKILEENASLRRQVTELHKQAEIGKAGKGKRRAQRLAKFLASGDVDQTLLDLATNREPFGKILEVMPDQSYKVVSVMFGMNICIDAKQEYYSIEEIEAIRSESKVQA